MKVLYLASFTAEHKNFDVIYQDINGKRDISGDMLNVDLDPYDVIIATPPCNYWSRANYRRETSEYAQKTKHLLPTILEKLVLSGKIFIVENVRSPNLFKDAGLFNMDAYVYEYGRHTYWTNIPFNPNNIPQEKDWTYIKGYGSVRLHESKKNQGGDNVHAVIDYWLETVKKGYFE